MKITRYLDPSGTEYWQSETGDLIPVGMYSEEQTRIEFAKCEQEKKEWTDERIIATFIKKARTPVMERSLRTGRMLFEQGKIDRATLEKLEGILIPSLDGKGVE